MKTVQRLAILVLTLALMPCPAASGISGSGTANHITKFIDRNTLGDSAIYEDRGRASIGTTSPEKAYRLTVDGAGRLYGIRVRNTGDVGIESIGSNYGLRGSGNSRGVSGISTNGFGVYGKTTSGYAGYFKGGRNYFEGNVGIGSTSPADKLDVNGDIRVRGADIKDASGTVRITLTNNGRLDLKEDGGAVALSIATNGNVGIGTTSPPEKMTVSGNQPVFMLEHDGVLVGVGGGTTSFGVIKARDSQSTGPQAYINLAREGVSSGVGDLPTTIIFATTADGSNIALERMRINNIGNVGIGTDAPAEKLTVRGGNLLIERVDGTDVVEIGEGLDYAEGFDISDKSEIAGGTVLVIDSENPGKLAISDEAYDSKVAGIVAGAKGQGSGVRLGAGQFDYDVALAGRVYCNVDATEIAVQPGDLLTTSATEGYAMKATDYIRAHGAILGKAMEKLEKGKKGQILVLVTLQ